jgi:hypothetical protein
MDRLIAAAVWHERQSLKQALLVAGHQHDDIDWKALDECVKREGIAAHKEIIEFYKETGRPLR